MWPAYSTTYPPQYTWSSQQGESSTSTSHQQNHHYNPTFSNHSQNQASMHYQYGYNNHGQGHPSQNETTPTGRPGDPQAEYFENPTNLNQGGNVNGNGNGNGNTTANLEQPLPSLYRQQPSWMTTSNLHPNTNHNSQAQPPSQPQIPPHMNHSSNNNSITNNNNNNDTSISRILLQAPWHLNNSLPGPFDLPPPAENGLPMNDINYNNNNNSNNYGGNIDIGGNDRSLGEGKNRYKFDEGDDWKSEALEREVARRVWEGLGLGLSGSNCTEVDVEKEKDQLRGYVSEMISLLQPFIPNQNRIIPSPPPPYLLTRFTKLSNLIHTILLSLSPHVHLKLSPEFQQIFSSSFSNFKTNINGKPMEIMSEKKKKNFEDMTPAEKEMEIIRKRRDALIAKAQAQAQAAAAAAAAASTGDSSESNNGNNEVVEKSTPTKSGSTLLQAKEDNKSNSNKKSKHNHTHNHQHQHQHPYLQSHSQSQSPFQQNQPLPILPPPRSQSQNSQHRDHLHHHHRHHQHHHHDNNHHQHSPFSQHNQPLDSLNALTEASNLVSHQNQSPYQQSQLFSTTTNINNNDNTSHNNQSIGINLDANTPLIITRCHGCGSEVTNAWMRGPDGPDSLCDLCGQHYAKLLAKKDSGNTPTSNSNNNSNSNTPIEALSSINSNDHSNNVWQTFEYREF
ncbi:uncharacterized protein L201_000042 [Kwoniella dendrophila CBS 6074]|uniref:GATA-type domain-containing protein n=1 Tax=Kwoniella dendrophila CBS 6074 TaxID=1295534 RepID=A0AAX4JI87_9TREE